MMKKTNNLDEMQEQKLLKIEHNGCWFAFWALLVAILIQTAIYDGSMMRSVVGEWIVFMCLAIYLIIGSLKNGIWDRKFKANGKTNLILTLCSSSACAIFFFISSYVKYGSLMGSIATGVIIFMSVFILTILTLTVTMKMYQKKISKMETDCDE